MKSRSLLYSVSAEVIRLELMQPADIHQGAALIQKKCQQYQKFRIICYNLL